MKRKWELRRSFLKEICGLRKRENNNTTDIKIRGKTIMSQDPALQGWGGGIQGALQAIR